MTRVPRTAASRPVNPRTPCCTKGRTGALIPTQRAKTWLEGRDADLFTVAQGEPTAVDFDGDGNFTAESDGIEFTETFATARPLPAGEYQIVRKEVWPRYLPCDYVLDNEWTITVEAPEGTLHEAFFDPVTDGTAVAADGTNGVLKPAMFTGIDGAAASVERIAWESGTVKLEVSPHTGLSGPRLGLHRAGRNRVAVPERGPSDGRRRERHA